MQPPFHSPPRVALFTDTFDEPNGVATLTRNWAEFARQREIPFFIARGGKQTGLVREGSLSTLFLKRGPASFAVDKDLYFDALMTRHYQTAVDHLRAFKPDLIHMTAPGDLGFLGLLVAHILHVPLVASWHTNVHEYLSRRLGRMLNLLPQKLSLRAACAVERQTLRGLLRFYKTARFVLAPNTAMVELLHERTGKPAFLMQHGVDLNEFSPRVHCDRNRSFCIGYVGRLTAEKNVRLFVEMERRLLAAGERDFKFLIVGDGGQQRWLQKHLRSAEMPGVLRGEALTSAYARMDAFVFPSVTDTFGLVILEAMACGVPVVLAPDTGRRVGVEDGISGFLSEDFAASIQRLMHDERLRASMSIAARDLAAHNSWQPVFEQLYRTYIDGLKLISL